MTRDVVRVGQTVRRPRSTNSEFVQGLLNHLAARGFEGVPASMGLDDRMRDVFAFVEGDVPAELAWHDDATLIAAAGLIRRFHDLGAELLSVAAIAVGIETVCHNDLSPCNFVFRAGRPVCLIDFDAAAPGSRADDLGYAAWLWLDLGSPEMTAAEQGRRFAVFLGAYGFDDRDQIVAAMLRRQAVLVARGEQLGDASMSGWAALCLAWTRQNAVTLTRSQGLAATPTLTQMI